jgi:hypothetical protein
MNQPNHDGAGAAIPRALALSGLLMAVCCLNLSAQITPLGTLNGKVIIVRSGGHYSDAVSGTVGAVSPVTGDTVGPVEISKDGFRMILSQGDWALTVNSVEGQEPTSQTPDPVKDKPIGVSFMQPNPLVIKVTVPAVATPVTPPHKSLESFLIVVYFRTPQTAQPTGPCGDASGTIAALHGSRKYPLSGAQVVIVPETPGSNARTPPIVFTGSEGEYRVAAGALDPDVTYSIQVSKAGYYPITLSAGCNALPELVLMSQEVDGIAVVQTQEAAQRHIFHPSLTELLPLEGIRNFDSLALLLPGVLPAAGNGVRGPGIGPGIGAPGQFSINGARTRENNFEIDGSDNNDEEVGVRRQGFVSPTQLAVESIAELQFVTSLADARYGRSIGGQIDALSRSGEMRYHGTAYGYLTDSRLNARNYFDAPPSPATAAIQLDGKPVTPGSPPAGADPFTRGQTGFNFSGPLLPWRQNAGKARDSFFFLAFERQTVRTSVTNHFDVAVPAERGIFHGGLTGVQVGSTTYFPASLPGDAIFSLIPLPNNPSGPYGANTFTERLSSDATGWLGTLKIDQRLRGPRSRVSLRYNTTGERSELPSVENAVDSSLVPHLQTQNVASYFSTLFTPRLANTFRFSFGRTHASFDRSIPAGLVSSGFFPGDPYLLNAALSLNVTQNTKGPPALPNYVSAASSSLLSLIPSNFSVPAGAATTEPITGAIGQIVMAGFSSIGVDPTRFPQHRADHTAQIGDLATFIHGRHVFHAGFDLRRVSLDSTAERNVRPQIEFRGMPVQPDPYGFGSPLPAPPGNFIDTATMAAAGIPSGIYQTLSNTSDYSLSLHRTQTDFFLQYEGRLTSRFSLSAGVRLEYYRLPEDSEGRLTQSFDVGKLTADVKALQAKQSCDPDYCQPTLAALQAAFPASYAATFGAQTVTGSPRLGFAWDLFGDSRTAIRGGAGIYTAQFPGVIIDEARSVFPSFLSLNFSSPLAINTPLQLTNPVNPSNALVNSTIIQKGTLNRIPANSSDATQNAVNLVAVIAQAGFAAGTYQLPSLQFTQPGNALKNGRSVQLTLVLERAIGNHDTISMGYAGSLGRHLLRVTTPDLGPSRSNLLYDGVAGPPAATPFAIMDGRLQPPQTDAYGYPELFPISRQLWEGTGESSYHSLQVQWTHRYSRGILFGSALTVAHAIDDVSDFFDSPAGPALPQDSLQRSERGSANFDSRLRLVSHFAWDIPLRRSRWLRGWQLTGIHTAQTGQPFTVTSSIDVNGDGNLGDRLNSADQLLRGPVGGDRRVRLALASGTNTASLLAAPFQDGRVGRNAFRAGGLLQLDAALIRNFEPIEGLKVVFRAEAFNVFNRAEFGIPVAILESASFGSSVNTVAPARIIQGGIKLRF